MALELGAVVVAATVGAAASAVMPAVLARVPDPPTYEDDEPQAQPRPERPTYPTFGELARRPGLPLGFSVAGAVAGALVGALAGWSWPLAWLLVLVPVGVLLSYVDWRTLLLPTRVIYPAYAAVAALMVVATLATGATDDLRRAGIAALVGLVCYWLPWRISASWMGFGDVRLSGLLAGVLGWAGWAEVALGLYLPFLLGGVVAGLLMLLRLVARGAYPLGPFMFVGTLVGLWCGPLLLPGLSA
ncbi:prepilin peptidase [Nocardioides zeae]|uniref:Prepilin peptidase n=1 Tax=Nocardioides zeae TaxID=1457234 RepID=A0A6P0HKX2_9ACTN|nr:prepilin peptidase [Nocardioides zeae]